MKRRTMLKGLGAGGLIALSANQIVGARSATVEKKRSSIRLKFNDERSDVTIQDDCGLDDCSDPCPTHCDLCWC